MNIQNAVLLLGPTGSGKSPLGDLLELKGLWGRKAKHFDFGEQLRRAAALDEDSSFLSTEDILLLKEVLKEGRLLENKEFHLAEKLLSAFCHEWVHDDETYLVMNGLPRHVDQANDVSRMTDIQGVIELTCSEDVILHRILNNVGGDRTKRVDDTLLAIRKRLERYEKRTTPLLDYYRTRGTMVTSVQITADKSAEQLWLQLQELAQHGGM